jgi:hypothetical protein
MEAQRQRISTISSSLDDFSANLVKNVFKPLSSLASPLTTGTTSSQAQENDWVSPAVAVTSSLPPLHAPTQRANVRKKQ